MIYLYILDFVCIKYASRRAPTEVARAGYMSTVGFREMETTVFDPASVFLSTH